VYVDPKLYIKCPPSNNYYRELLLHLGDIVKREQKVDIIGMFAMKHCCKDITKAITPMKLDKINFNGCRHM